MADERRRGDEPERNDADEARDRDAAGGAPGPHADEPPVETAGLPLGTEWLLGQLDEDDDTPHEESDASSGAPHSAGAGSSSASDAGVAGSSGVADTREAAAAGASRGEDASFDENAASDEDSSAETSDQPMSARLRGSVRKAEEQLMSWLGASSERDGEKASGDPEASGTPASASSDGDSKTEDADTGPMPVIPAFGTPAGGIPASPSTEHLFRAPANPADRNETPELSPWWRARPGAQPDGDASEQAPDDAATDAYPSEEGSSRSSTATYAGSLGLDGLRGSRGAAESETARGETDGDESAAAESVTGEAPTTRRESRTARMPIVAPNEWGADDDLPADELDDTDLIDVQTGDDENYAPRRATFTPPPSEAAVPEWARADDAHADGDADADADAEAGAGAGAGAGADGDGDGDAEADPVADSVEADERGSAETAGIDDAPVAAPRSSLRHPQALSFTPEELAAVRGERPFEAAAADASTNAADGSATGDDGSNDTPASGDGDAAGRDTDGRVGGHAQDFLTEDLGEVPFSWELSRNDELDPRVHERREAARVAEEERVAEEDRVAEEKRAAEADRAAEAERAAEAARVAEEKRAAEVERQAELRRAADAEAARVAAAEHEEALERQLAAMRERQAAGGAASVAGAAGLAAAAAAAAANSNGADDPVARADAGSRSASIDAPTEAMDLSELQFASRNDDREPAASSRDPEASNATDADTGADTDTDTDTDSWSLFGDDDGDQAERGDTNEDGRSRAGASGHDDSADSADATVVLPVADSEAPFGGDVNQPGQPDNAPTQLLGAPGAATAADRARESTGTGSSAPGASGTETPSRAASRAPHQDAASATASGPQVAAGGASGLGAGAGDGGTRPPAAGAAASKLPRPLILVAGALVLVLILVGLFFLGTRIPGLVAGPATVPTATPTASPAASETPTATAEPAPEPTPEAPAAPAAGPLAPGTYDWKLLAGGECLEPYTNPWAEEFTVVDCATPHAAQMVKKAAVSEDPAAAFPGEAAIAGQISLLCSAPGVLNLAAAGALNDVQVQGSYPVTAEQWAAGERSYYCFVSRSSAQPITGSLAGS